VLQQLLAQPDFLIRRAHQLAAAAFTEACADLDLTPSQYAALFALRQQQVVSQNELGRLIALDRSTTSVVLRSLKDRALVDARADGHDRRKVLLSLTDSGRLLLSKAEMRSVRSNATWLAGLGEAQSALFLDLLRRVAGGPK
jgi:DNA-binding MarR family transcriptional regulator